VSDLEINFAEGDEEVIPRGDYLVEVDEVHLRDSQRSEHKYFNFTLRIVEKANGDETEFEGRPVYYVASLSPNTERRTRKLFEQFGVQTRPLKVKVDEDSGLLEDPDLEGARGHVRIVHGMYENEKQARVRRFIGHPMEEREIDPDVEDETEDEEHATDASVADMLGRDTDVDGAIEEDVTPPDKRKFA
jgi:hypothetical protein